MSTVVSPESFRTPATLIPPPAYVVPLTSGKYCSTRFEGVPNWISKLIYPSGIDAFIEACAETM